MATGRVGGTRSKISGKVGSEVYTVRRDGKGSCEQVVGPLPESREDTLTEDVVEQRIRMSICYRYMKAIPFILNNAFKADETKSLNLQEFVRVNISVLRDKMKVFNPQINPIFFYEYGDTNLYPAPVKIGGFGSIVVRSLSMSHTYLNGEWCVNFDFQPILDDWTIQYWLNLSGLKDGDVILLLLQFVDDDPSRNNISYCKLIVNPKIPRHYTINPENFLDIFDIESQVDFNLVPQRMEIDKVTYYHLRFTKSSCNNYTECGGSSVIYSGLRQGKWARSEAFMTTWRIAGDHSYLYKDIASVWDSWYTNRLNE